MKELFHLDGKMNQRNSYAIRTIHYWKKYYSFIKCQKDKNYQNHKIDWSMYPYQNKTSHSPLSLSSANIAFLRGKVELTMHVFQMFKHGKPITSIC